VRAVLALVAWLLALLSGVAVAIGLVAGLLIMVGAEADAEDCECGAGSRDDADAVVVARVAGRRDDQLLLAVEEVERGQVAARQVVRTFGVELRPWRRYRLFLYADGDGYDITDEVLPDGLGVARPVGIASFGALPSTVRLAVAAVPLLVAALAVLVLERREAVELSPAAPRSA
jgi:hypothetical protein